MSYTPFGEIVCESMPIDPARMSLAVIITLSESLPFHLPLGVLH